MRNFNSHLSDDSASTGIGQTMKQMGKLASTAMDAAGKIGLAVGGSDTVSVNEIEWAQPPGTQQAKDLVKEVGGIADPVLQFYRQNRASGDRYQEVASQNPWKTQDRETNESIGYNMDAYALHNYNYKVATPMWVVSPGAHSVNSALVAGHFSMFNPMVTMVDYSYNTDGAMQFFDVNYNVKEGMYSSRHKLMDSCTVRDIVNNPVGRASYKYEDFMFCAELGKLSNNHLITLRRFPAPVLDNIFYATNNLKNGENGGLVSIGTLVGYFGGADNKLEDIINMDFHERYKSFEGEWQKDVDTGTDNDSSGALGIFANLLSQSYAKGVASGTNSGRGLGSFLGSEYQNRLSSDYRRLAYKQYDTKKIYTPMGIVNKTHQREGIMEFNNQFTLTFRYKMRSFNDINQKAAFLDLISNILTTTYRKASFWGGDINWIGTPQNLGPFKVANAIIDSVFEKAGGIWEALFNGGAATWFNEIGAYLADLFSSKDTMMAAIKSGADAMQQGLQNISEKYGPRAKSVIQRLGKNGLDIVKGSIKNKLGRPQVYALNSILSGAAVGPWHLVVGNPFNPIVVMGNLIVDKVVLQQGGALNIDDFPEELIVKVTLKHAKPRHLGDISKMYTSGLGELYQAQNKLTVEQFATGKAVNSKIADVKAMAQLVGNAAAAAEGAN